MTFVAIITCTDRARGTLFSTDRHTATLPPVSHGPGALCCGKGLGKSMNTVYAMIYIVAAALVVTGVFLVVTALTP
jgi:hypothetical protein